MDKSIIDAVTKFLRQKHPATIAFWMDGGPIPQSASLEDHCDVVYIINLLGIDGQIKERSVDQFCDLIRKLDLPVFRQTEGTPLSAHNCAYAFGALNLLSKDRSQLYDRALAGRPLDLDRSVNRRTFTPLFPRRWAHHSWRVSHWLGGIPSILLSLAKSGTPYAGDCQDLFNKIHNNLYKLIDQDSGFIKVYNSNFLHKIFEILYAMKHDPILGELGGIAHVLWIQHAVDSPYLAGPRVYDAASREFNRRAPFMEAEPYCLDFDVAQIVRTCRDRKIDAQDSDGSRANAMTSSIYDFLSSKIPENYTLHKLPGALATIHECAMIDPSIDLVRNPIDIIKRAYWL